MLDQVISDCLGKASGRNSNLSGSTTSEQKKFFRFKDGTSRPSTLLYRDQGNLSSGRLEDNGPLRKQKINELFEKI